MRNGASASPGCFLRRVEGIDLQIPAEERGGVRRGRGKWGNKVKRRSIERTRERPTVSRSSSCDFSPIDIGGSGRSWNGRPEFRADLRRSEGNWGPPTRLLCLFFYVVASTQVTSQSIQF